MPLGSLSPYGDEPYALLQSMAGHNVFHAEQYADELYHFYTDNYKNYKNHSSERPADMMLFYSGQFC